MAVTVFSKPHCPQCDATKRALDRLGVQYDVVDITKDPEALEQLRAAGFQQAPVVATDSGTWSGYRPDLLKNLAGDKA